MFWRKVRKWLTIIIIVFFSTSVLSVTVYKFLPVYVTPLMVIRSVEQLFDKEHKVVWHHKWVPLEKISKSLPRAVVASEDNKFLTHNGFDYDAIQQAIDEHKQGRRLRGGSTISQQTAKNVFLWPASSWVRKGLEAYFTVLIELIWGKERIMEVYLNSIEMGRGIYGAEAVAKYHFRKQASALNESECALIAATLPNPRRFDSRRPSGYLVRRQQKILSIMGGIPKLIYDDGQKPNRKRNHKNN